MTPDFLSALAPAAVIVLNPAAVLAILAVFVLWTLSSRASHRRGTLFDTRRTLALREAARLDDAHRYFRESRPGSSPVVFISRPWEERWWCEKLDVTADALHAAIREVGPMAADVQRYFGNAVR